MKLYRPDISERVADCGISLTQGLCYVHSFFPNASKRQTAFTGKMKQRPNIYIKFFISLVRKLKKLSNMVTYEKCSRICSSSYM